MAARRASASSADSHHDFPSPVDDSLNVFSDEYAESIAESFADSTDGRTIRRPSSHASRSHSPETVRASSSDVPRRPSLPSPWSTNTTFNPQYRGSLRKSLGAALIGQNQEENTPRSSASIDLTPHSPTESAFAPSTPGLAHRSPSFASTTSFARSQSPFRVGSGPSHPYGMYPQDLGMSRSASIATTASNARSQGRTGSASRAPAHPYGMYPQNIADDEDITTNTSIPVGFPGHSQNDAFQRRIGPDGEDQDIIGEDGHAEQLPPYTRYPEEAPAKMALGAGAEALPAIGEAVDLTDQQENANESTPFFPDQPHDFAQSRSSSPTLADQSQNPFSDRHATSKYAGSDGSGKSWGDMTWKERRDARLFGVLPVWLFFLVMIILIVIAAVCGGAVGGLLSRQHKPPGNNASDSFTTTSQLPLPGPQAEVTNIVTTTSTTTTMVDAAEVASTPTGFPSLPTGSFKVDVSESSQASSMCLTGEQRKAWSCQLEPDLFQLDVNWDYGPDGRRRASMNLMPFANISGAPQYGAQPPRLYDQQLKLAQDLNSPDLGLAFQFQLLYDKVVILEQKYLSPGSGPQKRDNSIASRYPWPTWPMWTRKSVTPTDQPWFCYFNSTLLEGFIYVQNDTVEAAAAAASSSARMAGDSNPSPTSIGGNGSNNANQQQGGQSSGSSQALATSATPSAAVSRRSPYSAPGSNAVQARDSGPSSSPWTPVTPYSKRIKLVERRLASQQDVNQPYCQQMTTCPDGVLRPALDGQQNPIIVNLSEMDPADGSAGSGGGSRRSLERRALPAQGCFCQWQWS